MARAHTREEIIAVADDLFYRQGYEHTSFADIAGLLKISRGNFYHHFKSKDDILDAVIEKRMVDRKDMLDRWEQECGTPKERIARFIDILAVNREKIVLYGCPIGTLMSELAKLNHTSKTGANNLFLLFRTWLRQQFAALGCQEHADVLAMQLLSRSQGAATIFNAFQDVNFIQTEITEMKAWLDDLAS